MSDSPQAKSGRSPVLINKVLLEQSHAHHLHIMWGCLPHNKGKIATTETFMAHEAKIFTVWSLFPGFTGNICWPLLTSADLWLLYVTGFPVAFSPLWVQLECTRLRGACLLVWSAHRQPVLPVFLITALHLPHHGASFCARKRPPESSVSVHLSSGPKAELDTGTLEARNRADSGNIWATPLTNFGQ